MGLFNIMYARPLIVVKLFDFPGNKGLTTRVYCLNLGSWKVKKGRGDIGEHFPKSPGHNSNTIRSYDKED